MNCTPLSRQKNGDLKVVPPDFHLTTHFIAIQKIPVLVFDNLVPDDAFEYYRI